MVWLLGGAGGVGILDPVYYVENRSPGVCKMWGVSPEPDGDDIEISVSPYSEPNCNET